MNPRFFVYLDNLRKDHDYWVMTSENDGKFVMNGGIVTLSIFSGSKLETLPFAKEVSKEELCLII